MQHPKYNKIIITITSNGYIISNSDGMYNNPNDKVARSDKELKKEMLLQVEGAKKLYDINLKEYEDNVNKGAK